MPLNAFSRPECRHSAFGSQQGALQGAVKLLAPGNTRKCLFYWWASLESNQAPTDYESAALTKHELEALHRALYQHSRPHPFPLSHAQRGRGEMVGLFTRAKRVRIERSYSRKLFNLSERLG